MAGTNTAFDAGRFRDAVISSMQMGMPATESERVKFVFHPTNSYTTEDPAGDPYDWTAPATNTTGGDGSGGDRHVEVPVAMEFIARSSQARDTSLGFMMPSHAELYIMDTHIDEVRDADAVLIDGDLYNINAWYPPIGLFEVTVYPLLVEAVDES